MYRTVPWKKVLDVGLTTVVITYTPGRALNTNLFSNGCYGFNKPFIKALLQEQKVCETLDGHPHIADIITL